MIVYSFTSSLHLIRYNTTCATEQNAMKDVVVPICFKYGQRLPYQACLSQ